jgi:hypothetical protein
MSNLFVGNVTPDHEGEEGTQLVLGDDPIVVHVVHVESN